MGEAVATEEPRVVDNSHDREARSLIVCCDGTGNIWRPGSEKTNVAKLFAALEKSDRQIAYYDPGVGTPDGALEGDEDGGLSKRDIARRVGGLAWGDGVWENVAQGYEFLMDNYRSGDRIYLFGFSRGAFTVRAVSGMLHLFGLLQPHHKNLIPSLLRVYRSQEKKKKNGKMSARQATADEFKNQFAVQFRNNIHGIPEDDPFLVPIHFIGVWDTVESVGVAEFLGGKISSEPTVKPEFKHVRHALALDEIRWPFKPREYIETNLPPGTTFKQVWFRGAHSDVGGSYKDDQGLSNTTWHWMVREAFDKGLRLPTEVLEKQHPTNPSGVLHSEVTSNPLWLLTGVFQRQIPEKITIHESVKLREDKASLPPRLVREIAANRVLTSCTIDEFSIEGKTVRIRVPSKSSNAKRQALDPRTYAALILSAVSGSLVSLHLSGVHGRSLALDLQLKAFFLSLEDGFGKALANFGAEIVLCQMRIDFLFIICYSVFATSLLSVLLYWSSVRSYPCSCIGKLTGYSLAPLVIFDLLENWLTVLALRNYTQSTNTQTAWIPANRADQAFALLTTLCSAIKLISLAGLAIVTVALLVGTIRTLIGKCMLR